MCRDGGTATRRDANSLDADALQKSPRRDATRRYELKLLVQKRHTARERGAGIAPGRRTR